MPATIIARPSRSHLSRFMCESRGVCATIDENWLGLDGFFGAVELTGTEKGARNTRLRAPKPTLGLADESSRALPALAIPANT